MRGTKLVLIALAICLAISLFDEVDATKHPHGTKKNAAAGVSQNELKQITNHLMDEVMNGQDHMENADFHNLKEKLIDHLKHDAHKQKHQIADPAKVVNKMKPMELEDIFIHLEVGRATHTLATKVHSKVHDEEKKKLKTEVADFVKDGKIYTNAGEEKSAVSVKGHAESLIAHMIKSKVIAAMRKKGFLKHQNASVKAKTDEIKKAIKEIAKAMKMEKIKNYVTNWTKEYKEIHESNAHASKTEKKKSAPTGGSKSASASQSPPQSPVRGGHGKPTHMEKHKSLNDSQTHVEANFKQGRRSRHRNAEKQTSRTNASKLEDRIDNGSNGNGTGDYNTEPIGSTGGLEPIAGKIPESYARDAGQPSFDSDDDLGQSEGRTLVDEEETKQEDTDGDTPTDVSQTGYTGSTSEDFPTNTNKEEDKDDLMERNGSPGENGTGEGDGVDPSNSVMGKEEGDMSEDKVEPSVVESDSAVGGITDRELASSNGDGKNESKSPAAEDGDDNVNGVNKGTKKETDNALE